MIHLLVQTHVIVFEIEPLSTEYARQSTEGYPAMVDLSVGMRVIRNQMVTQGAETAI